MTYTNAILYHFSGTGNARRAAIWMKDRLDASRVPAETHAITIGTKAQPIADDSHPLIGFLFPVHGFTTIWAMLRFILLFPRAKTPTDVFCLCTRAGLKYGRVYIPGYEGGALILPMLILRLKGYRTVGSLPLDMPSNWMSLHPSLNEEKCKAIAGRCRMKVQEYADRMLRGEGAIHGWRMYWLSVPLIAFAPVYLILGRLGLSKTLMATTKCCRCGMCVRNCPVHAIRFVDGRPYWTLECESCMRCISYCPRKAIQASWPLAACLYLATYGDRAWGILRSLEQATGIRTIIARSVVLECLAYLGYYILALSVVYGVFHFLIRFRPVNLLFEFTTPTRWYRRYREPNTRVADFADDRESAS